MLLILGIVVNPLVGASQKGAERYVIRTTVEAKE